jgi:hypothetical protein
MWKYLKALEEEKKGSRGCRRFRQGSESDLRSQDRVGNRRHNMVDGNDLKEAIAKLQQHLPPRLFIRQSSFAIRQLDGGGAWESNPPSPPSGEPQLDLKSRPATRPDSPPRSVILPETLKAQN